MAQQRPVPGISRSESTESQYRGDMLPLERSLATQNINPALPEGLSLSDNNAGILETAASPGLASSSMFCMGVNCRGNYVSPRAPLPTAPISDSSSSIDPRLSPSLARSPGSPGTARLSDPLLSPYSTRFGSFTRGSDGYFKQVNVERDDLENSRSDVSMSSPYIAHSDHRRLHSMTSMLPFESSGKFFPVIVS